MRTMSKNCYSILIIWLFLIGLAGAANAQTNISNSPGWFSSCPRLTVDPAGNVHAVWAEFYTMSGVYPTSGDAFYSKYNIATKQWSTPVNVSNSRGCYSGEWYVVGIDSDASGNVYIVYVDRPRIKLRIISASGWSSPFEVGSSPSTDIDSARVAVDAAGNIFVSWCDSGYRVVYSRARIGGTWENVATLTYPNTVSKFPEISVGTNRVYCVFMDNHHTPSYYTGVYVYRAKTFGAGWSSSQRLTSAGDSEEHPAVRVDANDVAHVVYTPYFYDGSRDVRYVEGTSSGFSSPIVLGSQGGVHYPALSVRGTNVYPCWQSYGVHYRNRVGGSWTAEGAVPSSSCYALTDVAASPFEDKLYYVWDTSSGEIYFTELPGPGPFGATLIISGTVRTPNGTGLAGVTIAGLPTNPVTSASGAYSGPIYAGWTGTATPTLPGAGYTFSPSSRSYTGVTANQLDQDFTAGTSGCAYTVSPTIHFFQKAGGTGNVSVTSSGGCSWSALSNAGWITVTSGSSGSGNGTVNFSVSSNAGSPSRSGTMTVAGKTVTVHQEGEILFNSSFGYIILPECIWAAATGGGTWVSEVQVTDATGGSMVSVYFSYGNGNRRGPITIWNNSGGARRSVKFSNLLSHLGSIDTGFSYYGRVGAVEFLTQDANHRIQVGARTLNRNYSKTFPGLIPADENIAIVSRPMMIQNFTNNGTYRSACGFFNPTTNPVTVEFRLYDANGATIGSPFTRSFVGYDFKSFNPFAEAGRPYPGYSYDNTYLVANPTSGTGGLVGYGASASNSTNDPAAHLALQYQGAYSNSPAQYIILPECIWAPATGGGTWTSEVQITDLTGGSAVTVYFDYGGGLRRGPIALWTNPGGAGRSLKLSNFLSSLGGIDTGFTYYGRVGSVEFVTQDSSHKIQVAARTKNGNFSKTSPGLQLVDSNTANTTREMIVQNYTNNSLYRSTCGFLNPTANAVTVEFRLYSSAGATIGSAFTKTFAAYDFKAFNPFNEAGVPYPGASYDNVILAIKPTSGSGKVICFGASANNSSNDPAAHIALQYR
jgi:hypothetical protein